MDVGDVEVEAARRIVYCSDEGQVGRSRKERVIHWIGDWIDWGKSWNMRNGRRMGGMFFLYMRNL